MSDDVTERLLALERRVTLLEIRAHVLRPASNRRILEVLGDFARSPFNDGSLAMTSDTIGNATGLDDRDLALALNQLQHAAFVESTEHWRITDDGLWACLDE